MKNEKTSELLHKVPLFQDLTKQELERVEEITISRFISKKANVFLEGSKKEAIYFIKEGLIKTYKTDESGHEQIVSFLRTGDMFPHNGFFNQKPYPATAEALVDTQLLAIPVQLFEQLIINNPSIAIKVMRVMGNIISELLERIQVLSGKDVKQRALSFLLKLAEQHGITKDNKIMINLPMTHQEFANAVGTTRETITRLFNQLSKEDILKVNRNHILITDLAALHEIME